MRREAALVAAGAAAGAALAAPWSGAPAVAVAAALGAALGLAPSRPRVAWVLALVTLLGAAALDELPVLAYALVAGHAFFRGRVSGLRAGLLETAALLGAFSLAIVGHEDESFLLAGLFVAVGWGAGRALGEREAVAERLAERARELEAEREAHAQLAARYERARIASELHDIVAHALSIMVVQASAGQRLVERDPALAGEALDAIATAARGAERDLGRLVALLGDSDGGEAAGLELAEQLVAQASASGLAVTLQVERADRLATPAAHLGYRVVQEGITNALRHAAGAPVDVRLRGGDEVVVEVVNGPSSEPAPVRGTGNGLRGLRERLDGCGGRLDAGPTPDGGWRLAARLPGIAQVRAPS